MFDQKHIKDFFAHIGEDPNREGLLDTPKRFIKAADHWFSGYRKNVADIMTTFEDGAEGYTGIVLVKNVEIYSHCEHHMAPFFGRAHIGYIPDGSVIGISKLARIAEIFARRLQVQERLTQQIADAIEEHLQPLAVGVIMECIHTCMVSRGVEKSGATTVTSSMKGAFYEKPEARQEFLTLCGPLTI